MTRASTRRVVVTGLGPVSSIGIGIADFAAGIRAGRSGISPISGFDSTGFPHFMAGEVQGFEPKRILRRLTVDDWGPAGVLAACAARLAVQDAGIAPEVLEAAPAGSAMGTTGGESKVTELLTEEAITTGWGGITPDTVGHIPASRLAYAVNRELGLTGEALTFSTACSASNYAIGYAYDLIQSGEQEYMIAGGADTIARWSHAGFFRLGAIAAERCAPFDRDRGGIITGEGGAALFLESLDSARARGARIYGEVLGYGLNCDANHMVAPHPPGIAECMRRAHRNAGISPADVDYICAHGTGTPANDVAEWQAVTEVFGDRTPPISSVKSMLGHTMGAASGFGAMAALVGMTEGFLPPTVNHANPDPLLEGLDPVPNRARPAEPRIVQNNGFAFGGNNAITIFGRLT
ncbi:3-oxoacyl-[acyl-carrier-protein] synthase II [Thermomonospora echinospora]|uniref:3-oxoacyl-[acyl-carrier-protein] synthase 1 n=1 Tax=Thermomonospora echinospora TaxID=1992 RepID=A0A1H5VG78_9ACTN|nr:beta-ketoacyl-[acyl-carrier-protein] synthase family protein [Thermomonospora echinospora]SEF86224.1 3-oxoacyl-[acyl-carrier-protein] synthase II [Thermomonospora echinospora]